MEAWKEELYHHGIKGMRWGVRRYQNPDGTLTPAGQKRYAKLEERLNKLDSTARRDTRNLTEGEHEYRSDTASYRMGDYRYLNDKDLKARNTRMELEIGYRAKLATIEKAQWGAGKKFVENMLKPALKDVATDATKTMVKSVTGPFIDAISDSIKSGISGSMERSKNKKAAKQNETTTKEKTKTDSSGNTTTVTTVKNQSETTKTVEKQNSDGSSSKKVKKKTR